MQFFMLYSMRLLAVESAHDNTFLTVLIICINVQTNISAEQVLHPPLCLHALFIIKNCKISYYPPDILPCFGLEQPY